ncbi:MAG: hypothetical protein WC980_04930 [Candidatus Brocadiia bacterium]
MNIFLKLSICLTGLVLLGIGVYGVIIIDNTLETNSEETTNDHL